MKRIFGNIKELTITVVVTDEEDYVAAVDVVGVHGFDGYTELRATGENPWAAVNRLMLLVESIYRNEIHIVTEKGGWHD